MKRRSFLSLLGLAPLGSALPAKAEASVDEPCGELECMPPIRLKAPYPLAVDLAAGRPVVGVCGNWEVSVRWRQPHPNTTLTGFLDENDQLGVTG